MHKLFSLQSQYYINQLLHKEISNLKPFILIFFLQLENIADEMQHSFKSQNKIDSLCHNRK